MVLAKTQVRSQIESQNAQREKKISQLNEFIARFRAGTRSSQVQSRRKEVERLQVTELAKVEYRSGLTSSSSRSGLRASTFSKSSTWARSIATSRLFATLRPASRAERESH